MICEKMLDTRFLMLDASAFAKATADKCWMRWLGNQVNRESGCGYQRSGLGGLRLTAEKRKVLDADCADFAEEYSHELTRIF